MEIALIALLTLVSSVIGTMTGFGTSTIMIPVLAMFIAPVEAIFLVSIIHWFGNIWKIVFFRKGFNLKLIALFGISGLITSYLGASYTIGLDKALLLRLLGIFLLAYSVFLLFESKFKVKANDGTALIGGSLSGFFAGTFGIGGAIRSMFLTAFDLPKATFIATAGAIGLMVDSTRIITYLASGTSLPSRLWWSLLIFIPVSLLGARIAKSVVDRIPQQKFRMVVAFFLLLIGAKLLVFPS